MSNPSAFSGQTQTQSSGTSLPELLRRYHPLPGVPDELMDATGQMRPIWGKFIRYLSQMDRAELLARFQRGNQYLRDAGVFYRKYGEESTAERDWPLSPVPVLVSDADWQQISYGLIQRADLLERVVADLYGPNDLVAQRHLPAALVAQNPGWLRPMVGAQPPTGHFLNFVAFEVGRGPSGQWWVLGDRTDAPSGAGFALENRVATSRVFPGFYGRAHVHRLAGFFGDWHDRMLGMRRSEGEPIALLTPGQMNDGYFEHAYLARYLGLLLVEGEDLVVVNGALHVRTVEGLRPLSVLWRRLDAEFCDPLELNESSALGTAGMLESVRGGALCTINALGAGVLESRALMAFLPKLSEALTGAPLALPNIATWWCGEETARAHVLIHRDQMTLSPAMAGRWPHEDTAPALSDGALDAHLAQHGAQFVGQERVTLSTAPYWDGDGLVPRPVSLRVFLARTEAGWQVLPGGYARIGTGTPSEAASGDEATRLAMQAGGSVSDVWVLSPDPVARPTLLDRTPKAAQTAEALPSRAADNLFWLGRYVERAEAALRAYRAYFGLRASGLEATAPLTLMLQNDLLFSASDDPALMAQQITAPLSGALTCATRIRDRFSVDGILALKELSEQAQSLASHPPEVEEIPHAAGPLLRQISGFAGLVHENMYRSAGWRFMSIGTALERAAQMAGVLSLALDPKAPDGAGDLALELGDSFMSHRSRYPGPPRADSLVAHLARDVANPRAIQYQLHMLHNHLSALPPAAQPQIGAELLDKATALLGRLPTQPSAQITPQQLIALRSALWDLADNLARAYLK